MLNNKTVTIETEQLKEVFGKFDKLNKLAHKNQLCELEYDNEKSGDIVIRMLLGSEVTRECELSFPVTDDDINSGRRFEGFFNLSMVSKAIKKLNNNEGGGITTINFNYDMPIRQINIQCGYKKITIDEIKNSEKWASYKIKDLVKEQAEGSFNFDNFSDLIKKSSHCTANKTNISVLNYFCFKNDKLVTVDGYRLTRLKTGTDIGKDQILVYNDIYKVVDIFKNKTVNISVYDDGILIEGNDVKLYNEKNKEQYIDYERIILSLNDCDIFKTEKKELLNNCEFLEPVLKVVDGGKVQHKPVCFKGENMIANTKNGKVEIGLIMEGGQWNVRHNFNIAFLKDALKSFDKYTETINIAVKSSDNSKQNADSLEGGILSPLMLFDDKLQHIELVLPVRVKDEN